MSKRYSSFDQKDNFDKESTSTDSDNIDISPVFPSKERNRKRREEERKAEEERNNDFNNEIIFIEIDKETNHNIETNEKEETATAVSSKVQTLH